MTTDKWLSFRLIMVFDNMGTTEVGSGEIYSDHSMIQDNYQIRQLIYNDPYLNGSVTMEFWRNLEIEANVEDNKNIERVYKTFTKFSNYRLFSVEQFKDHTLCKFDLPKTEVPVVPNMPLNLDWLTNN